MVGTPRNVQVHEDPLTTAVQGDCAPPLTAAVMELTVRFVGIAPVSSTSEVAPLERRNTLVGVTGLGATV